MTTTTILALSVLVCSTHAGVESQLTLRYSQWDAAYSMNEGATMARMLASDFRLITGSGKVISRKAYVARLGMGEAPIVYRTKLLRISKGKGGTYAWTEEESQKGGGRVRKHLYRDFWVLQSDHWLLRESKTLGEK